MPRSPYGSFTILTDFEFVLHQTHKKSLHRCLLSHLKNTDTKTFEINGKSPTTQFY